MLRRFDASDADTGRDNPRAQDHERPARGEAEERDCERSRADGHSLGLPFPRTVVPAQ
jgi:hypothetical protein